MNAWLCIGAARHWRPFAQDLAGTIDTEAGIW